MKRLSLLLPLLLAACMPTPDADYCKRHGEIEGTPEYGSCIGYYHAQDSEFQIALSQCSAEADATYPQDLYDRGSHRTARVYGGAGWGRADWDGPETIWMDVEPDEHHNARIDQLRDRIIVPCMNAKGWNGSQSWEQGRTQKPRGRR